MRSNVVRPTSQEHSCPLSEGPKAPSTSFEVELVRTLRNFAATGALDAFFGAAISTGVRSTDEAQAIPGVSLGDGKAWPLFVTPGYRNVPAPVFNDTEMRAFARDYMPNGKPSAFRCIVGEAARNVGQHAVSLPDGLRHGTTSFAAAGVFVRELSCVDERQQSHRFLICMIKDEGRGIRNPSESLLDGVGSHTGQDHRGLAVELTASLLGIIKSTEGKWFLYDGLNHDREAYAKRLADPEGSIPQSKWVKSICEVDLQGTDVGCQKIYFVAHPDADKTFLHREITKVLLEHQSTS